ncbi:unnamed protein product [Rhizopus microsporus]
MTYATAIITMFPNDNQSDIRNSRLYQDFIKALRSNTILLLKHWSCDVTPAIQYLKSWGLNSALNKAQLTAKTCWLLAMAGFLRPSDLERVDLDATTTITIHPHHNPLLCPVAVFEECKQRIASSDCRTAHPLFPTIKLTRLFRSLQNHTTPIAAERISKHIKQIMTKVGRPAQAPIPKARGLAATLAAQAGASADNIVAHGS